MEGMWKMRMFKVSLFVLVLFSIVCHFDIVFQDQPAAQAVWGKGTVTKAAWKERHYRIGINGIQYTFMPEVDFWLPERSIVNATGNDVGSIISRIPEKQMVSFKVQGHRIYELMIEN